MKQKELWINQIKGLCICLVVIYHSVITFYPHLTTFQHPLSEVLSKCWIYFNLYLAPFRMPVFFFISGYLIRRYIDSVPWGNCLDKRIWSIFWVLALWGVVQWLEAERFLWERLLDAPYGSIELIRGDEALRTIGHAVVRLRRMQGR